MTPRTRTVTLAFGALLVFWVPNVRAVTDDDPPDRVARLSDMHGDVSFSPAGESEWLDTVRNRPLIRGDRLWSDEDARAELQIGAGTLRLDQNTSVEFLQLDDRLVQIQLRQGTLDFNLRRVPAGQSYEINTPTLAFAVARAGRYRVAVDADGGLTTVLVWEGGGDACGDGANFPLRAGDAVRFRDTTLRDYEIFPLPQPDSFDRYGLDRDARQERSLSARHVGDDAIGYADLDDYGSWRQVPPHGSVWFPTRINKDWAPYRDGHWIWQEPWGWTWVDDQPWGFAPSHYGRWVSVDNRWGWIPGPRNLRAVYAPALVAFVGGRRAAAGTNTDEISIGWFGLGPSDIYVPPYHVSQDYFTRINVTGTQVSTSTIAGAYTSYANRGNDLTAISYANRLTPGAVTAVQSSVFVNSQSVRQAAIPSDGMAPTGSGISRFAALAPNARSIVGSASAASARPGQGVAQRRVIARTAPPPSARSFAQRQEALQRNPGQATEQAANAPRPRVAADDRFVRVVGTQPGAVNAREAMPQRLAIEQREGARQLIQSAQKPIPPHETQESESPSSQQPQARNPGPAIQPPTRGNDKHDVSPGRADDKTGNAPPATETGSDIVQPERHDESGHPSAV